MRNLPKDCVEELKALKSDPHFSHHGGGGGVTCDIRRNGSRDAYASGHGSSEEDSLRAAIVAAKAVKVQETPEEMAAKRLELEREIAALKAQAEAAKTVKSTPVVAGQTSQHTINRGERPPNPTISRPRLMEIFDKNGLKVDGRWTVKTMYDMLLARGLVSPTTEVLDEAAAPV